MNETNAPLILQIFVAVAILSLGRRLFWLFVAGIGFVAGTALVGHYLRPQAEWVTLLVAVGCGLAGALLALFAQKLAVAAAGFVAAAYLVQHLAADLRLGGEGSSLAMIVGGLVGALAATLIFDWALILLSSFAGAALLVDAFELDGVISLALMFAAAAGGVAIQAQMMGHDRRARR